MSDPLLETCNLVREFGHGPSRFRAVDGVSLQVAPGEVLGIVGESGSGKSTLARMMNGLIPPTSGQIRFQGTVLSELPPAKWRPFRRHMQMIFQDPYACLNPRMTVRQILAEPLRIHRVPRGDWEGRCRDLLDAVKLPADSLRRYPHEFSGGQRQRIGIARALSTRPALVLADEPVAALDVSVQAQVLNLLRELQREFQCAMVFIAHDLSVVQYISDRVAVMKAGKVLETGTAQGLFENPQTDYTRNLIEAIPLPSRSAVPG